MTTNASIHSVPTHGLFKIVHLHPITGAFGHTKHIFVSQNGAVWSVERIRSSYPATEWCVGDVVRIVLRNPAKDANGNVTLLPDFHRYGAEWAQPLEPISGDKLDYIWREDWVQQEAAKAAALEAKLKADEATPEELAIINGWNGPDGKPHGEENGRPEYYAVPLKSRAAIIKYLTESDEWRRRQGRDYDDNGWLFCFDVKLHGLDLDFDHLVEVYVASEGGKDHPLVTDAQYLADCRAKYEEEYSGGDTSSLEEVAIEDARRNIHEEWYDKKTGKHRFETCDSYSCLWNTDGGIKADFRFYGRSGGYLVLTKFQGFTLDRDFKFGTTEDDEAFGDGGSKEFDYTLLRQLYEYVTILAHDFKDPEKEVEHHAAFQFFENVCSDIPTTADEVGSNI